MPRIKIERVISFSSEDQVHVAENILSNDSNKKWKCKSPGEKKATLILQLQEPTKITGIDIGNEHSAFVEVLVGRSTFTNDEFKNILMMSSFMTPMDSRQSIQINRIRMFSADDFCKPVCDERWDRVMLVCTQPFNRHVKFGLSFITLHSHILQESVTNEPTSSSLTELKNDPVRTIGKFKFRDESPERIAPGSFFNKQKERGLSVAAAIREASSPKNINANVISPVPKFSLTKQSKGTFSATRSAEQSTKRNRTSLLYDEDDDIPNEEIEKTLKAHRENCEKKTKIDNSKPSDSKYTNSVSEKRKVATKTSPVESTSSSSDISQQESVRKRSTIEKPRKKRKLFKMRPFKELMQGVIFAISGYQNPKRSDIRRMAIEMGAKYKPDWEQGCTHLICAFANTPKYNEVRGKGKIILADWISESYIHRKRYPWRKYALDSREKQHPDSEEEILDESTVLNDEDENSTKEKKGKLYNVSSESSDTEDEIERIQQQEKSRKNQTEPKDEVSSLNGGVTSVTPDEGFESGMVNDNPYLISTDDEIDESPCENSRDLPKLPNYFHNYKFYISRKLDEEDIHKLKRYVVAYGGEIIQRTIDAKYIITDDIEEADEFREEDRSAVVVRPSWIWECNDLEKLVEIKSFLV